MGFNHGKNHSEKIEVLFVCEHLPNEGGIGGALINLLKSMDNNRYDIHLCVICNYIDKNVDIPPYVHVIKGSKLMEYHIVNYKKRKEEYNCLNRIFILFFKQIRRIIGFQKYQGVALSHYKISGSFDVAISYSNDICYNGIPVSGGSNYCVRNCVNATHKIAWIHNEVTHQGFTKEYCLNNFREYDRIVNVSYGCKHIFDEMVPEYIDKSYTVYNIVDYDRIEKMAYHSKPEILKTKKMKIVTAARLEEGQKRISRIFDICKKMISEGHRNFIWLVLGDGPDMKDYISRVYTDELKEYLFFIGRKENPYVYMKYADLFVLPSLYESFGLVLKEAIAVGCPVVATDFEASKEIINSGINGLICENSADGLYDVIKTLYLDSNYIELLKNNIINNHEDLNSLALKQFDEVVGEWI